MEIERLKDILCGIAGEAWVRREASCLRVQPKTAEEVSRILKAACETKTPVKPLGGGTGWWSEARPVPGGILLGMTRMDGVVAIDEDVLTVTAEAGITFARLEAAIGGRGYRLAIFPESGRAATLGGHIQTWGTSPYASSGFEDQATQIVALKVVLPTGEIVQTGSGAVAGAAGHFARRFFPADLTGLFIGGEGAFGVIVEATLKLHGQPEARMARLIGFRELAGAVETLGAFQAAQRRGGLLTLVEQRLIQRRMLLAAIPRIGGMIGGQVDLFLVLRCDGDGVDVRHHIEQACGIAAARGGIVLPDDFPEWWEGRYKLISDALKGPRIMLVVMLPMGRYLAAARTAAAFGQAQGMKIEMLGYPLAGPVMLAHAILPVGGPAAPDRAAALALARELLAAFMDLGGVPHRVGTDFLPVIASRLDPAYGALVGKIKDALDPGGIMNPGLVITGGRKGGRRRGRPA